MSKTLTLNVYTPNGLFCSEQVSAFLIPTELGPLMVEPGYTNLITMLKPSGVMWIKRDKQTSYYAIFGGALRMSQGDKADLYCEEINDGYEIDMARAIAARDRSLDRIAKPESEEELKMAKLKLAKSLARIDAKSLSEGKRG